MTKIRVGVTVYLSVSLVFMCLSAPSDSIGLKTESHRKINRKNKIFLWLSVLKPMLYGGALRHRNTRELYSNNLRAVAPNHAQLKTKQNRQQDNKTRHRDQYMVDK